MFESRVFVIIFIICLVAIGVTTIIGMLTKSRRIFKYIPCIVSALGGIGFYIKSEYFSSGFEDIGYILLAIGAGIFFITALITAVVIDIVFKRRSLV